MGITVNGPSGIDTQSLIDSLVALETDKILPVQKQKKAYQVKIDAFSKFKSLLSDVRTKATALSKVSSFDLFTTTSSDEKVATVKGGTGSVDSQYDVKVFQLAASEKMISGQGKVTDQLATLTSQGITAGEFSIDGVGITIDGDDTIQDLRLKINNATDSTGAKLGVSASVLKVADNDFRLVLTSKNSGSAGVAYKDVSGSVLQDLGIITDAAGNKGNTNQTITSSTDILSGYNSLATGENIQFTGTDRDGKALTGVFVKKADSTSADFLKKVTDTFGGMVNATFDATGNLVVEDKVSGSSQLSMGAVTVGTTSHTMAASVIGDEGKGVLSVGKDAFFSVESVLMSSAKNSASGFVTGATFELTGVSKDTAVKVELKRDTSGIQKKMQELIDAYNAIVRFSKDTTKHANPDDEKSSNGSLAGDTTVTSIVSQLRGFFKQPYDTFAGTYTNFTMIGLKTNVSSGEFELDDEQFQKAMDKGFDEVVRLFTTTGSSSNTAITMGRNTADTKSGKYNLEEVDATHYRIQLQGSSTWFQSDARTGDIVTFSDGLAKGLSLTAPAGSGSATFSFSKGLASVLDQTITSLNDANEGLIFLKQESWKRGIKNSDQRVEKMQERVAKYRTRLVKQFSAMEQAISAMQSQGSQMASAMNYYSN